VLKIDGDQLFLDDMQGASSTGTDMGNSPGPRRLGLAYAQKPDFSGEYTTEDVAVVWKERGSAIDGSEERAQR